MHNQRILRQINYTAKKIRKYSSSGQWWKFTSEQRDQILQRFNELINKIGNINLVNTCVKSLVGLGLFVLTSKGLIAQTYQTPLINPFGIAFNNFGYNYNGHNSPATVDIDADGDLDLFVAGIYLDFFENVGTATVPNFGPQQIAPFNLNLPNIGYYNHVDFGDLDNDGDMDIISGGYYGAISYQENIGTASVPNFGPLQNLPFGITYVGKESDVTFVDIDGDGDLDLMITSYTNSIPPVVETTLFTNTGTSTSPAFSNPVTNPMGISPPIIIPIGVFPPYNTYLSTDFGDVDCDGDLDLLMGLGHHDTIYFQENISGGLPPVFAPPVPMPFGMDTSAMYRTFTPELADMDNDGDLDLFVGDERFHIGYFEMTCCTNSYDTLTVSNVCNSYTSPSGNAIWNTSGTYHDTLPNASGCDSLLTINLTITPGDTANFNFNPSFCHTDPDPIPILTGTTGGVFTINNNGVIDPTSGQVDLLSSGSGNFVVTYITNGFCPDTTTSTIVINATPIINAGTDVTIDAGQSTTLNATGTNGSYTWTPPTWLSCITCVSPIATPETTITYNVVVVDSNGCTASDQVTIIVDYDIIVFIPNVFTPNGDGENDRFIIEVQGIKELSIVIYNRWGLEVGSFENKSIPSVFTQLPVWNGEKPSGSKVPDGTYYYIIKYLTTTEEAIMKNGFITLIR